MQNLWMYFLVVLATCLTPGAGVLMTVSNHGFGRHYYGNAKSFFQHAGVGGAGAYLFRLQELAGEKSGLEPCSANRRQSIASGKLNFLGSGFIAGDKSYAARVSHFADAPFC